ncbi:hypothetical protein ACFE04_011753 [Oxalis oulophora]
MSSQVVGPRRSNSSSSSSLHNKRTSSKKSVSSDNGVVKSTSPSAANAGERTVKKLRLSKALTIPEGTTIMTRNPMFVTSDTLAIEALHKMVEGKFRHLPVVENGEVIAMLDITKCLYDAISRMEKAAEQGSAIAAAVEGVERQWGTNSAVARLFRVAIVMTPNPECATLETTILDALHIMHDMKFLHLPVLDRDGNVAACLDVLQISHAAISMAESSSGTVNDMTSTMMQKFWDSALTLEPAQDFENHSEMSEMMASDGTEQGKFNPSLGLGNSISFKFEDRKGAESISELVSTVLERIGEDQDNPQLLVFSLHQHCDAMLSLNRLLVLQYEDDEGDKVILSADGDLISAVSHARSAGQKVLRLHLDFSDSSQQTTSASTTTSDKSGLVSLRSSILAGAVALTGIGVLVYLKRSQL